MALALLIYVCSNLSLHDQEELCVPGNFSAFTKGSVARCNLSCNLQRNSTLKRCKFVANVWYVKNILANYDGNMYLPILHLPRVELHCKLQEKLHRVTGP